MNTADNTDRSTRLAAVVRGHLEHIRKGFTRAIEHGLVVGAALLEAKKIVPHDSWASWVDAACGFSSRTAQSYMRLADSQDALNAAKASGMTLSTMAEALEFLMNQSDVEPAEKSWPPMEDDETTEPIADAWEENDPETRIESARSLPNAEDQTT